MPEFHTNLTEESTASQQHLPTSANWGWKDPVWLAAYTKPRHEKAVLRHLEAREIESFLPLYKALRKWKNGCTVQVELPVFPSYVFVHIEKNQAGQLLAVPGLLVVLGSGARSEPIPAHEIESLRTDLAHRKFEPHSYLAVGETVRIKSGPLAGMTGILTRRKNCLRVVLSIEMICQSAAVEVNEDELEVGHHRSRTY